MAFTADDPRRRAPRHLTELPSDLGDVVDLSKTGMRVTCKGKPAIKAGVVRQIKLRTSQGSIAVTGRAVWVKRTGFRKYEVGIDFVQIKPKLAKALAQIAEFGFIGGGGGGSSSDRSASGPFGGAGDSTAKGGDEAPPTLVRAAVEMPDYYAILGITAAASAAEVHSAYRAMARLYHPDTTEDPEGVTKFIAVSEAYEILKDAEQRRAYDRLSGLAA